MIWVGRSDKFKGERKMKYNECSYWAEVMVRAKQTAAKVEIGRNGNSDVPEEVRNSWVKLIDQLRETLQLSAVLIMRLKNDEIEVFARSVEDEAYYPVGEKCGLGHGLYCETVVGTNQELLVEDASKDIVWENNPDMAIGMKSYFGVPLHWSNGAFFGTLCVLDNKKSVNNSLDRELFNDTKERIEKDLAALE